ncbi:MAG: ShlB/FhaC/HecB family hemolysin secretion/activation protein [Pseudomonadota bacterium]
MRLRLARLSTGTVLALALATAWAQQEPVPDAPIRFEISRFDVSGNTLLPAADVTAAVAPFAGKNRDFGDVQRALEALEAVYHARGYNVVTVELPEQELNGGVVRLVVVQTKIGRINVTGNKFFDEANIRRSLPTLVPGQTPNLNRISENLKMANENPAKKVTMKLASGEGNDEVDANLEVADEKPWKASLTLDNTGTGSTGKTHVSAALQYANLWGRDHVGSLQYTTTAQKPSQVSVYGAGYHIPFYELGDSLDLFANYSNVDSGSVTAGIFNLAVSGRGAVYGTRYNHTLDKHDKLDQRLIYGFDYKVFKNDVLLAATNFGNNVTVHPLSINYVANKTLEAGEGNLSVTAVHNVAGGSKGKQADFTLARIGAKADFNLLRFAGAYTRLFANQWQLRAIVNGQATSDALIPGEQFGAGGSSSVRGFSERELSGDSGLNANLELYSPGWCGNSQWQCRALAFYDVATISRNHILAGELNSSTIGGIGVGLRLNYGNAMSLQMDVGHVVQAGATASAGKNRVHLRVGFAF